MKRAVVTKNYVITIPGRAVVHTIIALREQKKLMLANRGEDFGDNGEWDETDMIDDTVQSLEQAIEQQTPDEDSPNV